MVLNNTPLSVYNTVITEDYLRNQPEGQYLERKGLDTKPAKIAEEIIGMLNADGGVLVFGVSDNGEIQDLSMSDKLETYRNIKHDFITPTAHIELEEIYVGERLIFLYHVEQDLEQIYARTDNEQVFLRVSDSNRKLNREAVKRLEYDKSIRQFEDELVDDVDLADLDNVLLESYKEKLNYRGSSLDLLVKRHLASKKNTRYLLKNSAILLFTKVPEKYIPNASVRYIRYQGTESKVGTEHNVVKDERFENNIPTLIEQLRLFLKTSLKDYVFLSLEEGKFKKVAEYPEEAWLEGVVNALCHRSYNIQGNAVYIKHFDNRLEISNSGPLPAQVTIENIKTERFARNPRIARVLEDMGYVRQLNEGVSRIYQSMEKSMLSTPEYCQENSMVYLTLRNKISNHAKTIHVSIMEQIEDNWALLNTTQRHMLAHLFYHQQATKAEFAEILGIHSVSIARYLNQFIADGILERRSEKQRDPNALYTFKNM